MIEVKISFTTPDELVAFFSKAQVQTTSAAQHELPLTTGSVQPVYNTSSDTALPAQVEDRRFAVINTGEALPEEPALKPKAVKGTRKTKDQTEPGGRVAQTPEPQAGSGVGENPSSAEQDAPVASANPTSGDPAVEQAGAEAVDAASDAPAADVKYTIDDARAALTRLNDRDGIDAVRTLLAQMGASRISELPVAKYGDLIAACPSA